jgi:hypothetical protein
MTFLSVVLALGPWYAIRAEDKATPRYVGMSSCKSCHNKQYQSFSSSAKKSSSFQSINRLRKELTPEEIRGCYACHLTGYGKPGGFVSEEATPDLKNAGCEVCHGPGELHVMRKILKLVFYSVWKLIQYNQDVERNDRSPAAQPLRTRCHAGWLHSNRLAQWTTQTAISRAN